MTKYFCIIPFQYPIFKWCRDHRIHHKFTETTADPHNASRGFWFLEPMDPAVKEKEAMLDLSDLDNDPIVQFQTK
jgi:stearoyl-CoA desaturase (delta-9 desaturase)